MIVLGIESCSDIASVALCRDGKIIGETIIDSGKNHSIVLAPMVADLLRLAGLGMKDVDGVAVDVGPGSFTGLRIGISLATSLAYGKDIPVVRVTALEALLSLGRRLAGGDDVVVVPLIYGRKKEVYCIHEGEGKVMDISMFLDSLDKSSKYLFIGDGALAFKDLLIESGLGIVEVDESFHYIKGGLIAYLGLLGLKEGKGTSPLMVDPVYLRRPEVDVNLEKNRANGGC